jgi:hypothetical protein
MWKKVAASVTRRRFLAAGGAVTAWALLCGPGETADAEVVLRLTNTHCALTTR